MTRENQPPARRRSPLLLLPPVQLHSIDDEPDRLSNRLLQYDPAANKWAELCPMMYSKYRCSAVALNDEIYVMGKNLCLAKLYK